MRKISPMWLIQRMLKLYTGTTTYFGFQQERLPMSFVTHLAMLFRAYGEGTALESVALRAAMLMPILLLQKPHSRSKTREHVACLSHRLVSWNDGDIDSLMQEGHAIQNRFHGMRGDGINNNLQLQTWKFAKLIHVRG